MSGVRFLRLRVGVINYQSTIQAFEMIGFRLRRLRSAANHCDTTGWAASCQGSVSREDHFFAGFGPRADTLILLLWGFGVAVIDLSQREAPCLSEPMEHWGRRYLTTRNGERGTPNLSYDKRFSEPRASPIRTIQMTRKCHVWKAEHLTVARLLRSLLCQSHEQMQQNHVACPLIRSPRPRGRAK
jgi:hypothetical protein